MKFTDLEEDGRIVKGVNTTVDVGTGQVSKEANKLVGKVDKDGYPPELHSKAKKNSKPNTLYNLGLAEALIQESQPNTPEPERYTALEWAAIEGGHTVENISHTGTATAHAAKKKKLKPGDDAWFKHWFSLPYFMKEGYKLELERDTRAGLLVLNILDTKTGKRTEVRGKPGYESGNYDPNDPLHQLIDRLGKAVDISQLMNGEPVGINPKHPDGKNAKTHADKAFNEAEIAIHKGNTKIGKNIDLSKSADGTFWLASPKADWDNIVRTGDTVDNAYEISSKAKLATWDDIDRYSTGELEAMGYDGVRMPDSDDNITYQIWNTKILKPIDLNEAAGVGRVVKGVNTNVDVAYNEGVEVDLHGNAERGYVLSKIEVPKDQRGQGVGSRIMQQIVNRMDKEGAIIALTPDSVFGGSKSKLIDFYKRFGFVPNKGRNKDFRFRETMIRYPKHPDAKKAKVHADKAYNEDVSVPENIFHMKNRLLKVKRITDAMGKRPIMFRSFVYDAEPVAKIIKKVTNDSARNIKTGSNQKQNEVLQKLGVTNPTFAAMATSKYANVRRDSLEDMEVSGMQNIFIPMSNEIYYSDAIEDLGMGRKTGGRNIAVQSDFDVDAAVATYKKGWPSAGFDNEIIVDTKEYYLLNLRSFLLELTSPEIKDRITRLKAMYGKSYNKRAEENHINDILKDIFKTKITTYDDISRWIENTAVPFVDMLAANRGEPTQNTYTNYNDDDDDWLDLLDDPKTFENFADGKRKGKSRPGRVKRSGASCKGSVTDLRKRAKKYGGERGRMYHWCANMKSGKKKK